MAGDIGSLSYFDRVFFDSDTGVAGIEWPVGTAQLPSDVIADVLTMCAARNLHTISVHGALAIAATMEHYNFVGYSHETLADILSLGGQDVDGSHMEGLFVTGTQAGTGFLTLEKCVIYDLLDFQGKADFCDLFNATMRFRDNGYIDMYQCNTIYGVVTINVQAPAWASLAELAGDLILTTQNGGVCRLDGFKGSLEIDEMTGGTLDIYAQGADIQINADCDAPSEINIWGNARVTIVGAPGATINDYTKETQLNTVESKVDDIEAKVDAGAPKLYVEQIPDTDVDEIVTNVEADCPLVDLTYVIGKTYCLRHLRLKCADPGVGRTVTVKLYERWNDAIAQLIDSFDIDSTNFGTYHSLMDIFSVPEIHSDAILIRAVHDGASPADDKAIEVTYRHAIATT